VRLGGEFRGINGQTGSALLGSCLLAALNGVGMMITWEAIFEQWPWFGAAAAVLVVVIGLPILLKPKSKRQSNAIGSAADNKEWVLTGRIDFVDPHSAGECFRWRKRGLLRVQAV
jgi:hypothetical protein